MWRSHRARSCSCPVSGVRDGRNLFRACRYRSNGGRAGCRRHPGCLASRRLGAGANQGGARGMSERGQLGVDPARAQMDLSHLRRESRTALELAVVAMAPSHLVDRLATAAGLLEALVELPTDSAPVIAIVPRVVTAGRSALEDWKKWNHQLIGRRNNPAACVPRLRNDQEQMAWRRIYTRRRNLLLPGLCGRHRLHLRWRGPIGLLPRRAETHPGRTTFGRTTRGSSRASGRTQRRTRWPRD